MSIPIKDLRLALMADEFSYDILAREMGTAALPALAELATGPDVHLAARAIYLASLLEDPRANIIEVAARSEHVELRAAAAVAASKVAGPKSAVSARSLLNDTDASVRKLAARAVPDASADTAR